jgi:ABC-type sugar transport system ATPase subunit
MTDFAGRLEVDGRAVRPQSPQEANARGVAVMFQKLSLVPSITVADNIFLGRSPGHGGFVENLPIGQQQLTEITKALAREARVIVMDKPASTLNAPEVKNGCSA